MRDVRTLRSPNAPAMESVGAGREPAARGEGNRIRQPAPDLQNPIFEDLKLILGEACGVTAARVFDADIEQHQFNVCQDLEVLGEDSEGKKRSAERRQSIRRSGVPGLRG
jgi:hypothetical protein